MQRAKRRLTCSRATASSLSNTSVRTSSAGGDCVAVSRDSNRFTDVSETKNKFRKSKYTARMPSSNLKNAKKTVKSRRPTFGSLQNAVVLAPFYTLKRAFQTKLVDLYSHEKLKKLNNKIKMAKKQNVSFEYDVLEVKPPGNGKTTGKRQKKKKPAPAKRKQKVGGNGRSQVYCQCDSDNITTKSESKPPMKHISQNIKIKKRNVKNRMENAQSFPETSSPVLHLPLTVYNTQIQKKRRLDNQMLGTPLLKTGLALKYSKSNGNLQEGTSNSFSNVSSKGDSWETFSDSLSLREERLEGSLAISTTSFDSCLEQSSFDGVEPIPGRSKRSRYNTRMKMIEALKESNEERLTDFPPKTKMGSSRHLIMNRETKNSDERIDDFMDREPQSRGIPCNDISQNLQPLPRRSRTKAKKPSPETACNYYLRSLRDDVENKGMNTIKSLNHDQPEPDLQAQRTLASTSRRFLEEEIMRQRLSQNVAVSANPSERNSNLDANATSEKRDKQTHFLFQSSTKNVEESYSQTDEIFGPLNPTISKPSGHAQVAGKDTNDSSLQTVHNQKSNLLTPERETQENNQRNPPPKPDEKKTEEERKTEYYRQPSNSESRFPEEGLVATTTATTTMTTTTTTVVTAMTRDLMAGIQEPNRYQDPSPSNRPREPQDKESNFIFGPRSTSARVVESCEFSFGLNWVLSDEEDSDHGGDRFL